MPGSTEEGMIPPKEGSPMGDVVPPGAGAPSATPSGNAAQASGEIEMAKANVNVALSILEHSLAIIGSTTEEGGALISAIKSLSSKFSGKKSEDLVPAELMNMMSAQPDSVREQIMKEMGGGGGAPTTGIPTQ